MAAQDGAREVTHNTDRDRYEITVGGELAGIAAYTPIDGVWVFNHTVVPERFEGQGIGGQLVGEALHDVHAQGQRFAATCSFVVHWLQSHHEFDDLLLAHP